MCPLSANTYGIEFLSFIISDYDTKNLIFEVCHSQRASLPAAAAAEAAAHDLRHPTTHTPLPTPRSQLVQVSRDRPPPMDFDMQNFDEDSMRKIR